MPDGKKRKVRKLPVAKRRFTLADSGDLRTNLARWQKHHKCGAHWLDFLEIFFMTVADLQTQLDALAAKIAAIPPAAVPVATQADLDALGAKIATITASVPS